MSRVKAFRGLRPPVEIAAQLASRPYDVMNSAEARIEAELARLRPILSDALYSEQDDTLQECIGRMLAKAGKTVSAAESCTGGTVSALFTEVSPKTCG